MERGSVGSVYGETMDHNVEWWGKTAVVTGGASGIGLALAERFVTEGLNVCIADRDPTRLPAAVDQLRAYAERSGDAATVEVLGIPCDVTDEASVEGLAAQAVERFGKVHILCNNAGTIRVGRVWEVTATEWSDLLNLNIVGIANGLRAFVPAMLTHGERGHIVNTASAAGLFGAPSFAAYCATKAAAVSLTETLAIELAEIPDCQLGVSVLCPGGVSTNLYRDEAARRERAVDSTEVAAGPTAERWERFSRPDRTDQFSVAEIADQTWDAIESGQFWILPIQPEVVRPIRDRLAGLSAAFDGGSTLRSYFAAVDGQRYDEALGFVADDAQWWFVRPDNEIGGGRDDLERYIAGRAPLGHRIDAATRDGQVELAVGASVDGDRSLGAFIAAMRTDDEGRIDRYFAAFSPDHDL